MKARQRTISGIPFVSWAEAARMDYPDKEIANPSMKACGEMIELYVDVLEIGPEFFETDASFDVVEGGSIDDIRKHISEGHPIMFGSLGLTPFAHPVSPMAAMTGFEFPETGPYSGLLGPMASLELIVEKQEEVPALTVNESL